MSTPINSLTQDFAVAPQLAASDMAAVAAAGFKSVIINRPDYEGGADQPSASSVMEAARAAGLTVEYQPVASGGMTAEDVVRFKELLHSLPAPVLAYCRSGTRCTVLYRAATGT
ncbi:MAG: TIGR01244 family sulfur transferase [Sheuella sp.]|nr:TIGR01244 family sulfur transferase [Sheuella sp.]